MIVGVYSLLGWRPPSAQSSQEQAALTPPLPVYTCPALRSHIAAGGGAHAAGHGGVCGVGEAPPQDGALPLLGLLCGPPRAAHHGAALQRDRI